MRILLASHHRYPAWGRHSAGCRPRRFPSGSGYHLHDLLARGLAELGHEVLYLLPKGWSQEPPEGVQPVREPVADADLLHTVVVPGMYEHQVVFMKQLGKPWLATCHMERADALPANAHWIFVSDSLARAHGMSRYVTNGIDPAGCCFSLVKRGYFLFLSAMDRFHEKGLDTALGLSRRLGFRLIVAGTARSREVIDNVAELCRSAGAEYVGDVRGKPKADLLAGANALLFPSRLNEGCPLVLMEALMSGTPVIASNAGGCAEMIGPEVGFLCSTDAEFEEAIRRVQRIDPAACRRAALERYHYLRMTRDYVREYEREIAKGELAG